MPNPIPYKDLFDVDGLKMAVTELQAATDAYGNAATEDFKRIESVSRSLRKELEKISQTMQGGSIRLMDDAGQQQVTAYSRQISELTAQYRNMQDQLAGLQRQISTNNQALQEARLRESELRQELTQGRIATQAIRTETAEYTLQTRQAAQANREASQAQTAATGSYREAQNQLRELGKSIRDAEGGFEGNTAAIREQITEYNTLNQRLIAFDAQMGNHQRQVGNYAIANRGLSNSINQITRELPAFTFSMQTGLLGISNNLPILADEIQRTRAAIQASTIAAQENAAAVGAQAAARAAATGVTEAAAAAEGELAAATALANAQASQTTVWRSLASGLFSWQTAMGIGILLLTLYGAKLFEFIGALFKGKDAINEAKLSFQSLNKALEATDFKKAIEDVNRLGIEFDLARKGLMSKEDVLKTYNETLGKTLGTTNDFNIAEQATITNAKNYVEATLYKAAANLSLEDSAKKVYETRQKNLEIEKEIKDYQENGIGYAKTVRIGDLKKEISDNNKELDNYLKTSNDVSRGFLLQYEKFAGGFKKVTSEIADSQLTSIEQIKQRIAELSKLPTSAIDGSEINNRIDALKKRLKDLQGSTKEAKEGFALLEEQLNKLALQLQKAIISDYAKNQGKETDNTRKLADAYVLLTEKIAKLKEAYAAAEEEAKRRERFNNRGKNPVLSAVGQGSLDAGGISTSLTRSVLIKELEDTTKWLGEIQAAYAHTNDEIFKSYKDRKITLAEYNQQIQVAQDSAAEDTFAQDRKIAQARLELAKLDYGKGSKEYIAALKNLSELQDKYNKESLQRDERLLAAKLKLQQETISVLQKSAATIAKLTGSAGLGSLFGDVSTDLINGIGDSERFQKVAELGMDAINTFTDFAINASNRRIEQLNKERDHDIGLAGNNAEAKAKIEEEYNKKVSAEKTKQAKLARAAAAIDIIINTAVAVSKVIGQTGIFGIGLAPIIAALGAIELGIVLSQPLPQYAKGRTGGDAELAEVNERGPELIGQKGKWRLANRGMRGVTFLNKGDEVKTATDTKQMLANGMINADGQYVTNVSQSKAIYDQYIMASNRAHDIDYGRMAGAVADGVSGLPVTEHNFNERGYQTNLRVKNTRMMDVNRRNRF